jgi:hypothetical protein
VSRRPRRRRRRARRPQWLGQGDLAAASLDGVAGLIHDQAQEPGRKRPREVELTDALIGADPGRLHDLLGDAEVARDQVGRADRAHVMRGDQAVQCVDVAGLQAPHHLVLVHGHLPSLQPARRRGLLHGLGE